MDGLQARICGAILTSSHLNSKSLLLYILFQTFSNAHHWSTFKKTQPKAKWSCHLFFLCSEPFDTAYANSYLADDAHDELAHHEPFRMATLNATPVAAIGPSSNTGHDHIASIFIRLQLLSTKNAVADNEIPNSSSSRSSKKNQERKREELIYVVYLVKSTG